MKTKSIFAALAVALFATSCTSDEERLASELIGTWSGAPESLAVSSDGIATMTPVYTFEKSDSAATKSGDLTISAMINAVMPINAPMDAVVIPFKTTVSAIATINGTWTVTDDDEVAFNLNYNTLTVNVNPENITAADDALTDGTLEYFQTNKPLFTEKAEQMLTSAMQARFMALRGLDDVEIKNDVLEHEVAHVKMYLHKDGTLN